MTRIRLNKLSIYLALILSAAMLFSSCGGNGGPGEAGQSNGGNAPAQSAKADDSGAGYPIKVTDAIGTEIVIEKKPAAIISLTLGTDEILVGNQEVRGLVDTSRILSVTRYADDPGISNISDQVSQIPERVASNNVESIIALKPDLVLTDTWSDPAFIEQLRDSGITVYVFQTPNSVEMQIKTVKEIAKVVGEEEEGARIVKWMEDKLKYVADKLAVLDESERLTVMEYSEMFTTSGIGTNFDSIVTNAGLINVISRAGIEGWPQISKEQIVEFNPDLIILPSWYYDKNNTLESMIAGLKADKSLSVVKAIANDRLISVPNEHLSAISQFMVLGVEDVAKAAYPELFKND